MIDSPFLGRHGYYDRELQAHVTTWRDTDRCLVGFIYLYADDEADIVYFVPVEGKTEIRVHHTTTRYVDDPEMFAGRRLDSRPDPDTDPIAQTVNPWKKPR